MRGYIASFNDAHVAMRATAQLPVLPARWPGFATAVSQNGVTVVERDDAAPPGNPLPAIGARVVSCDGKPVDALMADVVGRYQGRWDLEAQRVRHGWRLFYDEGNPEVVPTDRCIFEHHGRRRALTLAWRPAPVDLPQRMVTGPPADTPTGVRTLPDGLIWIALNSFSALPGSAPERALTALIATLQADAALLRTAPCVVLDVRGNDGGSSHWSRLIARVLWGDAWTEAKEPQVTGVDWRVSDGNLAHFRALLASNRVLPDADPGLLRWLESVTTGLAQARARGQALWFQEETPDSADVPDPAAATPATDPPLPLRTRPVYVLTDSACVSACLDALDLWLSAGAVQVGRPTSADTLYLDVRPAALPSGLVTVSVPQKVYRGRPRGDNVPYVPSAAHRFVGAIDNTAAVERWIAGLPGRR